MSRKRKKKEGRRFPVARRYYQRLHSSLSVHICDPINRSKTNKFQVMQLCPELYLNSCLVLRWRSSCRCGRTNRSAPRSQLNPPRWKRCRRYGEERTQLLKKQKTKWENFFSTIPQAQYPTNFNTNHIGNYLPFAEFLKWRSYNCSFPNYTVATDTDIGQIAANYAIWWYNSLQNILYE